MCVKNFWFWFFLILPIIIILLWVYNKKNEHENLTSKTKPYLWVYWENIGNDTMPAYISLCRKTVRKHCQNSFNLIELNEKNIYNYIPELKEVESKIYFNRLPIAQKVDYYRLLLLHKYGGIYIDADTIVMRDLKEIADKLYDYDYVGFGEYFLDRGKYNSYGAPQNWVMASRKNGIFITQLLKDMTAIFMSTKELTLPQINKEFKADDEDIFLWHTLGKCFLRSTLEPLLKTGYHYYHYTSDIDGTRDASGRFITTQNIFSNETVTYKNIDELLFIAMSNWHISRMPNHKVMTEQEFLDQDTNFAALIKHSLGLKKI